MTERGEMNIKVRTTRPAIVIHSVIHSVIYDNVCTHYDYYHNIGLIEYLL